MDADRIKHVKTIATAASAVFSAAIGAIQLYGAIRSIKGTAKTSRKATKREAQKQDKVIDLMPQT